MFVSLLIEIFVGIKTELESRLHCIDKKTFQVMGGLSKVGVIGAGKMAGALLRGWIGSGVIKSNQVNSIILDFCGTPLEFKNSSKTKEND